MNSDNLKLNYVQIGVGRMDEMILLQEDYWIVRQIYFGCNIIQFPENEFRWRKSKGFKWRAEA